MGSSTITRHPWVIPVTGCDLQGRPTTESNIGNSIGRHGLMATAREVTSLGTDGKPHTSGGTSSAAPFVTGTVALLWSLFPSSSASTIKMAVCGPSRTMRRVIAPPLLDAWAAHEAMTTASGGACMMKDELNAQGPCVQHEDVAHRPSHHVRLPGFLIEEEIGLGDVMKRTTYAMGIKPCSGCERRAATLNRWMTFTR